MVSKISGIRKLINHITFMLLILLFIRLSISMGTFKLPALQGIIDIIFNIDDLLIAPIAICKDIIAPLSPAKMYLKSGFVEPVVLITMAAILTIRYIIEVILGKIQKKLEDKAIMEEQKAKRKRIFYTEWKGD